jgi:hypothetical protein
MFPPARKMAASPFKSRDPEIQNRRPLLEGDNLAANFTVCWDGPADTAWYPRSETDDRVKNTFFVSCCQRIGADEIGIESVLSCRSPAEKVTYA